MELLKPLGYINLFEIIVIEINLVFVPFYTNYHFDPLKLISTFKHKLKGSHGTSVSNCPTDFDVSFAELNTEHINVRRLSRANLSPSVMLEFGPCNVDSQS